MNDEQLTMSSLAPVDGLLTVAVTAAMLAISGISLRGAFRAAFSPSASALAACRRWAIVATVTLFAWVALADIVRVDAEVPALVAIAAADCWLLVGGRPRAQIPRAIARRHRAPA